MIVFLIVQNKLRLVAYKVADSARPSGAEQDKPEPKTMKKMPQQ